MKSRIFFILSGMILLIAGVPAVEARDSTGTLPTTAQPGTATVLGFGTASNIYANSNVPTIPATFNTVPASSRCPADTTIPQVTVYLIGPSGYPQLPSSTQKFRYISLVCSPHLDANYKASCSNAFGVWANNDGSGGVVSALSVGWVVYCFPI